MTDPGRRWRGRAGRHALIAAAAAAGLASLYAVIPTDFVARRLTLATAYTGLGLLCLALLVGPAYVLRGRRPPVSIGWRRDLGIWAALVSLAHVVVGLRVHFRGDWVRYFLYRPADGPHALPVRLDGAGWANHAGLAATVILLLLLALSNDAALRRLGPPRWKALQRLNYLGFGLIVLHGVAYQVLVRRAAPAVALLALMVAVTVAVQAAAFRARRRGLVPPTREQAIPR